MKKTNAKKIVIISITLIIISLLFNINIVEAATSNTNKIENYAIETNNEEEVSETIKDLILTINSEGMNESFLAQTISLYAQVTEEYTNNEIATMIEYNKNELVKNGVSSDNVDSITKVLRSINTEQTKKVLSQVNIDEVSAKIQNGENLQTILQDITENMSATEKVSLVVGVLLSANMIRMIFIILIVLFIYRTLLRCVIYKKAGRKAWAPFVPIYRNVVMLKICGMSPWWLLLIFVPVIGWVILWIVSIASRFMLAEGFGKGTGFAFGLWLLAPIFETILVLSKETKYIGFEEDE